ncbi:hypothetical protein SSABA_v1c03940 [Spiroplasma sabaudiense Ar-1343]|uniref:Uncharacterized protein n=1 Tax=Spiroplasma sabaudiense Ar-1343 TaxID=1276257 RepID=W6A9J2_9MOLU|nr:hypothetical protein [Spiroplasma sabaudiense]AHI53803.1 hypothetical protein SSABA_v1c03940 [Spiroplasma sabaudiense Ar-1343]
MKKIIKTLAVISPSIMLANQVVACADKRIDIREYVDVTDLGMLENLKNDTIIEGFVNQNPRFEELEISLAVSDSWSHGAFIKPLSIVSTGKYKGIVEISFSSKLGYKKTRQDQDQICLLSHDNKSCNVDIDILDPEYSPTSEGEEDNRIGSQGLPSPITEKAIINEDNKIIYRVTIKMPESEEIDNSWRYSATVYWYDVRLARSNIKFV